MPYYDTTLTPVYNFTRGYYVNASSKAVGIGVGLPSGYNPSNSYPVVLCFGDTFNGSDDVYGGGSLEMFNSDSPAYYFRDGSYSYANRDDFIIIAFQSCQGDNGETLRVDAVEKFTRELIANAGSLDYYTRWGTSEDTPYTHVDQWAMSSGDNPTVFGSTSNLQLGIDTDRIYYTGTSVGALDTAAIALALRDVIAGALAFDGTAISLEVVESFLAYIEGVNSAEWVGRPASNYLTNRDYTKGVKPTKWDIDTNDFEDGSYGTSDNYSVGSKRRMTFTLEEMMKPIKHLPFMNAESGGSGALTSSVQMSQETLYAWNNAKDATWNNLININSMKVGADYVMQTHVGSAWIRAVYGELDSGNLYVFDMDNDDLLNPLGIYPIAEASIGSKITCIDWLFAQNKSNNPAIEAFTGFPATSFLLDVTEDSIVTYDFNLYNAVEYSELIDVLRFAIDETTIIVSDIYDGNAVTELGEVAEGNILEIEWKRRNYMLDWSHSTAKLRLPIRYGIGI
jgi:hypothetical protein